MNSVNVSMEDYCLDIAFTLKVAQLEKLSFSKLLIK